MSLKQSLRLLTLTLLLASAGAPAGQTGMPAGPKASRFSEVALCVAVLEREVKSRLHAKPTAQEQEQWQLSLESAFALTGDAYLKGLSGDESKALLDAAKTTVASWQKQRLQSQAVACQAQGQILFNQASGLQQLIVRNAATRLLKKELAKLQSPPVNQPPSERRL